MRIATVSFVLASFAFCLLSTGQLNGDTVSDVVDQADWDDQAVTPAHSWAASAGGLLPTAGGNFFSIESSASNTNGSATRTLSLTQLMANVTYTVNLDIGDKDSFNFIEGSSPSGSTTSDRIAFGFFDSAVTPGNNSNVRDSINSFLNDAETTFNWTSAAIPTTGWETWTYEVTISDSSSFVGTDLDFGIAGNTGNTLTELRGFSADNLSISFTAVPEPSSMIVLCALGLGMLRRRQ